MNPDTQQCYQRKQRRRKLLRALNGAALGVFLGGLVGALQGAFWGALMFGKADVAPLGALYGLSPGMLGGTWIGASVVIQEDKRGVAYGTWTGVVVGWLYAIMVGSFGGPLVFLATVCSGFLGGLGFSLLIRWIRNRWPWWTRWEE